MKVPYFTIVLLLTAFTHVLLSIYGPVHWAVLSSAYSISSDAYVQKMELKEKGIEEDERNEKLIRLSERIKEGGHKALQRSSLYHLTGYLALIFSIVGAVKQKGMVRFASLPLGLYAASMATIVM